MIAVPGSIVYSDRIYANYYGEASNQMLYMLHSCRGGVAERLETRRDTRIHYYMYAGLRYRKVDLDEQKTDMTTQAEERQPVNTV